MSHAFVKEPIGDPVAGERPACRSGLHPNFVTVEDYTSCLRQAERDPQVLDSNLHRAPGVDPRIQCCRDICFGARVTVVDVGGDEHTFTIVGEEEACAPRGRIGWSSSLAEVMLGKRVGDVVVWEHPAGNTELKILQFEYL
jgi:transcription elongation factor GreB